MLAVLGLAERPLIAENYLNLAEKRAEPRWQEALRRMHEQVGQFTFGITSGVLTTTGLLVGVEAATTSRVAIIGSLVTIAIADASSDAYGMYVSRMAQRGTRRRDASKTALRTWIGKFVLPFTFIAPLLLLSLRAAVTVDIAWAYLILALLSAEQAFVRQESVLRAIVRHIILATGIIVLSYLGGAAVHILLQ